MFKNIMNLAEAKTKEEELKYQIHKEEDSIKIDAMSLIIKDINESITQIQDIGIRKETENMRKFDEINDKLEMVLSMLNILSKNNIMEAEKEEEKSGEIKVKDMALEYFAK